jgi:hypothetical protein
MGIVIRTVTENQPLIHSLRCYGVHLIMFDYYVSGKN